MKTRICEVDGLERKCCREADSKRRPDSLRPLIEKDIAETERILTAR